MQNGEIGSGEARKSRKSRRCLMCTRCNKKTAHRSHRRWWEKVLKGTKPEHVFRCSFCGHRFWVEH